MAKMLSLLALCALFLATSCEAAEPMNDHSSLNEILQQTIDSEQLAGYYHTDKFPERIPLRLIENKWVPAGLTLSKFGQPVEIASNASGHVPYMRISNVDIRGSSATVSFEYPPEGVAGTAHLSRQSGGWVLDSMTLVEK
jgi:hypothetical protein